MKENYCHLWEKKADGQLRRNTAGGRTPQGTMWCPEKSTKNQVSGLLAT